ncbi:MAG: GNAT family N-acetyltransferase [Alphaproteobacteria bacterium]|nr:GNAT family N-acetyltransferase [Alphaproteobacteria bacterium]MDE2041915.1 GNAT family N-acetyltransferase [Alphaproteobacteria bacterium]MDE2341294.1 GNAT family N-acetyltransferase [Alphaproteobacteria bacterium]
MAEFTHRLAHMEDIDALRALMKRAIEQLQDDFLSSEQVIASQHVMGLDTQLIRDQTYFMVLLDGTLAGCGGWSWRATLYGGDTSVVDREPEALDPAKDAARVRAMYTDPAFVRRGVGRMILTLCEEAARTASFGKTEMMATMAGVPLYEACGYAPIERVTSAPINGVTVPLVRMGKIL